MCELQKGCWQIGKDLGKGYRKDLKITPSKERLRLFIFLSCLKRRIKDYLRKRSVIITTL